MSYPIEIALRPLFEQFFVFLSVRFQALFQRLYGLIFLGPVHCDAGAEAHQGFDVG